MTSVITSRMPSPAMLISALNTIASRCSPMGSGVMRVNHESAGVEAISPRISAVCASP